MLVVAARDRMTHGIAEQPLVGEPSAGRGGQLTDPVGIPGSQTRTQCVGKEVVVAIPPTLIVERDDEHVLALKGLRHQLTIGATSRASHSPPVSRSSTEVSSRNPRTTSGCRLKTSSTR